ncbi:MAG: zf-HC2 domain-containing protein [Acidobacteria bacterium]|nr:zf-HC2 domain-containing protein [Acidobacteriota bacterium]
MKRHIPEDRISAWVDRQLDPEAMAQVDAHLRSCAECRSLAEEMSAITEAYRSAEPLDLPPHLWARIASGMNEPPTHGRWSRWLQPLLARPSWVSVPAPALVLMVFIVGTVLFVEFRSASRFEQRALSQIEAAHQAMASLDAEKHNPFHLPAPDDAKVNPFARSSVDPLVNPFSAAQQIRQQERQP